MLPRLRRSSQDRDDGFTLVELPVAMIILGILASISIPAFLNQKKKAQEASVKADVSAISKELAAHYMDGVGVLTLSSTGAGGTWKLDTSPSAGTAGVAAGRLSAGNRTTATNARHRVYNGDRFCIAVYNGTAGSSPWKFSARNGLAKGACLAADL